jgi:hypothetical protein
MFQRYWTATQPLASGGGSRQDSTLQFALDQALNQAYRLSKPQASPTNKSAMPGQSLLNQREDHCQDRCQGLADQSISAAAGEPDTADMSAGLLPWHLQPPPLPAAMSVEVSSNNPPPPVADLAALVERHVVQWLASGVSQQGMRDGLIHLQLADHLLSGAQLVLVRSQGGWALKANADQTALALVRQAGTYLVTRFANLGLGKLTIDIKD